MKQTVQTWQRTLDFRERIVKKLQQTMAEKRLKGMLLFRPENSAYVSGYLPRGSMSGPVVAVIPSEGHPTLVTNFYEEAFIKLFSWVKDLRVYESYRREAKVDPFIAAVKEVKNTLKEQRLSGGLLGTDDSTQSLSDSLTFGRLVDISNILAEMRLTKSEEEINLIKEACHIADVGHETFLDSSQENTPEIEVRSMAQLAMYAEAFRRLQLGVRDAHMALVGSGLGSGKWPYWFTNIPTDRRIKKGDMLVADGGAVLWSGYNSDVSRTAIVGSPTSKQKEMYQAVLDAQDAGKKTVMPGVRACEVDKAICDVFSERGYAKHITRVWNGHNVGFGPRTFDIAPYEKQEIRAGMVLTLEPGLYVPEVGGIRVEDMVAVREAGAEVLTKCRKNIM